LLCNIITRGNSKRMANIFNSMTYYDISGICLQRSRKATLIPPPQRLELQKSPYVGPDAHTQYALDMRRKAEILKYATMQTQTNSLTKAQRFAQLVNGSSQRRNYSSELLQGIVEGTLSCENLNNNVPTSTASCDIPGPEMMITLDPTVPLYNYVINRDPYSILPVEDTRQYITYIQTDIAISSTSPTELFVLYIDNNILNPQTTFQFTLPFTIQTTPASSTMSVIATFVYVYYNSTLLATNDTNGAYTNGVAPLIKTVPTVLTPYSSPVLGFSTGVLSVSNLSLYTNPGYILDVKVIFLLNLGFEVTAVTVCNPAGSAGLQISS